MRSVAFILLAGFTTVAACAPPAPSGPRLASAHAHNDYVHKRPLLDALEHGFASVEADIHLVHGELLVAHDPDQVVTNRTLSSLYLRPLLDRVIKNGGSVYPGGGEFTLLVDLKTPAAPTYAALRQVLREFRPILTSFRNDRTETNAVTVILSGDRPQQIVAGESIRWVGIDGRLSDLTNNVSRNLMPLISDNWTKHFQWRGSGPFPEAEKKKLGEIVRIVHERGCKLRFWAAPDQPEGWAVLRREGVDLINTDNLPGLRDFLLLP